MSRSDTGFSLISLLIAMVIGLFLMGGIGKVYLDSKVAYVAREAVATASENARFSIEDLRRTLMMVGRGIDAAVDNSDNYDKPDDGLRTFPALAANGIVDIDNADGNLGSSVIAVRYAEGIAPCGGVGTISGVTTVRFLLDESSRLVCEIDGVSQVLVSGVVRMRALYGVDTDVDGAANQYLTATEVEVRQRWNNVVAIRVGLIVSSGHSPLPVQYRWNTDENGPEVLGLLGTNFTMPDNTHFFKSVSTTILLRNLNTTVQRQ